MNNYFKAYLTELQSEVFSLAWNDKNDIVSFVRNFMLSPLAYALDAEYSAEQYYSAYKIYTSIKQHYEIAENGSSSYGLEPVSWLGFFYRQWHFITGESSKQIIAVLPPEKALRLYASLHILAPEKAIERMKFDYAFKQNKLRKHKISKQGFWDPKNIAENHISSEKAAQLMLMKLFNDQRIADMKETYEPDSLNMHSDEYSYSLEARASSEAKFYDDLIEEIKKLNQVRIRYQRNILFIFLADTEKTIDFKGLAERVSQQKEKGLLVFDDIVIYENGIVHFMDSSAEVSSFYLPFSLKERNRHSIKTH
jgi:hypothetical protein